MKQRITWVLPLATLGAVLLAGTAYAKVYSQFPEPGYLAALNVSGDEGKTDRLPCDCLRS
jgi:hypothetical protein